MTHEDLVAKKILDELPPDDAQFIRTFATRTKTPIKTLLKQGLLKVSAEIRAASQQHPAHA